MKKLQILAAFIILSSMVFSQTYKDGWGIGFGLTSPRMFGDVYSEFFNFGGHVSIQKDLDEVNTLRFKVDYLDFTSGTANTGLAKGPSTTALSFGFDYLFAFSVCHPVKLYLGTGFGFLQYTLKDAVKPLTDESKFGELSFNFFAGGKYAISREWDLKGEIAMHQISTDRFDGVYGTNGGLFGGTLDSYLSAEAGLIYYFERGAETKYCDAPGGVTNVINQAAAASAAVDYDRIQRMIDASKTAPVAVDYNKISDMLDAKLGKAAAVAPGEAVLVGINFDVNSASIKAENYAILAQDAAVLLSHPDIKVEVAGYTDKDGAEKANLTLSSKRATNVKNYLVAKGVDAARLTVKGYGESSPVSDEKAYNRRVEFKLSK